MLLTNCYVYVTPAQAKPCADILSRAPLYEAWDGPCPDGLPDAREPDLQVPLDWTTW